jgi:hypothetical protein
MTLDDHDEVNNKNENQLKLNKLISDFSRVDGKTVVTVLEKMNLTIPRLIRIKTLRQLLTPAVDKTLIDRSALADELCHRLSWFKDFSDTQLVNLFNQVNENQQLNQPYMTVFWTKVLNYFNGLNVNLDELSNLVNGDYEKLNNLEVFNEEINPILHDDQGCIDGLTQENFRVVVYHGSTTSEIRQIGLKYGVNVPKRLRKKTLLNIIFTELEKRDELNPKLAETLTNKNIMVLERFAKDHDIKVSTELKKDEIIEYILANANETKASYYEPTTLVINQEKHETAVNVENIPIITSNVTTTHETVTNVHNQVDHSADFEAINQELKKLSKQVSDLHHGRRPRTKKQKVFRILLIIVEILLILITLVFLYGVLISFFHQEHQWVRNIDAFFNHLRFGGRGIIVHIHEFVDEIIRIIRH